MKKVAKWSKQKKKKKKSHLLSVTQHLLHAQNDKLFSQSNADFRVHVANSNTRLAGYMALGYRKSLATVLTNLAHHLQLFSECTSRHISAAGIHERLNVSTGMVHFYYNALLSDL